MISVHNPSPKRASVTLWCGIEVDVLDRWTAMQCRAESATEPLSEQR
jgi:hypothetical protein